MQQLNAIIICRSVPIPQDVLVKYVPLPLSHLWKTRQFVQPGGCTEINEHLICSSIPACTYLWALIFNNRGMHVHIPWHLVSNLFFKILANEPKKQPGHWCLKKSERPLDCQSWWQSGEDGGNPPGGLKTFDLEKKEWRWGITWKGSLAQNSWRGLCHGGSLAAGIPEVTET